MPTTTFEPTKHGFPFANRFRNTIATLPTGGTLKTNGRCGGMAFAAMDIFHAGKLAPHHQWSGFERGVPPDGTPLADYLFRRLLDSFREPTAVQFGVWTLLPDERFLIFKGVTAWTASEIPKIRRGIDSGQPVALGLVGARQIKNVGQANHQAVAFGYTVVAGGVDFAVYDNNTPSITVTLSWRRGVDGVAASNRKNRPWRGMFAHRYESAVPPKSIWNPPPAHPDPVPLP